MANNFGVADMEAHLIFPLTFLEKIDITAAAEHMVSEAGFHGKMRLRTAYVLQVDAVADASAVLTVKHGNNIAATVTGGADPVGHCNVLTIAEAYRDVGEDESILVTTDGDATTGDGLFMLMYEAVE